MHRYVASAFHKHRISAENESQSFKRHTPLSQIKSLLNFISARHLIWQDKAGADSEDRASEIEFDPPHFEFLLLGLVRIVKAVAATEGGRKKYGVSRNLLSQESRIVFGVLDTSLIVHFALEGETEMLRTHRRCGSFPPVRFDSSHSMGYMPHRPKPFGSFKDQPQNPLVRGNVIPEDIS